MKLRFYYLFTTVILLTYVSLQAQTPSYRVEFFAPENFHLNSKTEDFFATHLNNLGQIVGIYENEKDQYSKVFFYSNGNITLLEIDPVDYPYPCINTAGQIAGSYAFFKKVKKYHGGYTLSELDHAYMYENDTMTDLGFVGGKKGKGNSFVYAINDLAQMVGASSTNTSKSVAVAFWKGKIEVLQGLAEPSNNTLSIAMGINNNQTSPTELADIVGQTTYSTDSKMFHAFLYSKGVMTDIGVKICPTDFPWSQATDINDSGQIAGTCCKDSACVKTLGFIYDSVTESIQFIKVGNDSNTSPYYINNKGQVLGMYTKRELPFVYTNQQAYDLLDLLKGTGITFIAWFHMNDEGQILINTNLGVVLLTPNS